MSDYFSLTYPKYAQIESIDVSWKLLQDPDGCARFDAVVLQPIRASHISFPSGTEQHGNLLSLANTAEKV